MAILDQHGNPYPDSTTGAGMSSHHFAGAASRSDRAFPNGRNFKDDFEKLIPDLDRQFIVSSSRRLFENFGPWSTPMVQKADNAVGRAWDPTFKGEDREWGKIAVDWLTNQWFGNCDVKGRMWDFKTLLWLDSVAIDRDGDFLIYLTKAASGYPLTQRISVNRIGQRHSGTTSGGQSGYSIVSDGRYKGLRISHGVIRDKFNRAIAYRILGDLPSDDVDLEANRCIHVLDPRWHDQVRGIPSGTAAIKMIYGSMTATEREQMNQLVRSSFALVEYNETGGPDLTDPSVAAAYYAALGEGGAAASQSPIVESLAGGMIKYFRSNSGGKMEAVDNNTPGDMWENFQDRVIRFHAAANNWPYELYWKSEKVSSALVRNIQERARMSVEDRQDVLKGPALFQIRYAISVAMNIGILPRPKNPQDWWKFSFQMPRKFSIDPGRDAQQRREDYKIGLRNRTGIIAEEGGGDIESFDMERITEVFDREERIVAEEERRGIKIDRRLIYMMGPNDMATQETAPEPEPPEEEEDETEEEEDQ
jgi:capsid protein